jgi:hypothetical protein
VLHGRASVAMRCMGVRELILVRRGCLSNLWRGMTSLSNTRFEAMRQWPNHFNDDHIWRLL